MSGKIILNIVSIIILSVVQISLISALPLGLSHINILVVVIVFILGLRGERLALYWALGAGLIMDIYSFSLFGANILSLFLVVYLANLLLDYFFTDRSLYSFLAITFFATLSLDLFNFIFNYAASFFISREVVFNFGYQFFFKKLLIFLQNTLVVFPIFFGVNFVTDHLRPVFLIKK